MSQNQYTQNILNSIEAGQTTIEGWQAYKERYELRGEDAPDPYQEETYQAACEALQRLTTVEGGQA
jgi:hypothetical protein